jgi:hypothetical protein
MFEQLQPKLFLSAGPSATKHGPNRVVLLLCGEQTNGMSGQLQGVEFIEGGQSVKSNCLHSILSPVSKRLRVQQTLAWL